MRSLWFKQRYLAPILAGEKTDTVRGLNCRPPKVGELIGLAVGPRPAFAAAVVTAVQEVDAADLDPERRAAVAGMCSESRRYLRIAFRVLRPPPKESRPAAAPRPAAAAR